MLDSNLYKFFLSQEQDMLWLHSFTLTDVSAIFLLIAKQLADSSIKHLPQS
jgi:hypothetical protein